MSRHTPNMKKLADYNGIEPLVSTLCVGLLCALRTFDTVEDKQSYFIALLDRYIQNLSTYNYEARNYSTSSFLSSFTKKKIPLTSIPREHIHRRISHLVDEIYASPDTEYYTIQREIFNVFNKDRPHTEYHEEYNNYMAFIIYSFYNLFPEDTPENREIIQSFVIHFVDFNIEDKICVYDKYDDTTTYAY